MSKFKLCTPADIVEGARVLWRIDEQRHQHGWVEIDGWVYFINLSMLGSYKLYHVITLGEREGNLPKEHEEYLAVLDPEILADFDLYQSIRENIINRYKQGENGLNYHERIVAAFALEKRRQERENKITQLGI